MKTFIPVWAVGDLIQSVLDGKDAFTFGVPFDVYSTNEDIEGVIDTLKKAAYLTLGEEIDVIVLSDAVYLNIRHIIFTLSRKLQGVIPFTATW